MKTFTIGRSGDNDLILGDRSVSRHHAELRVDDGRFHLIDLDSTNGTYVRDGKDWVKIEQAYVAADERIMLGDAITTVAALLAREMPGLAANMSIRAGERQIGDETPQSYDAYLRQRAAAAPAAAGSPGRLPWLLFAAAVILLVAAGTVAAVRFWDELEALIAPPAEPAGAQPAAQAGWERVIGGPGDDIGYAATALPDGGFVIAGSTDSKGAGLTDLWLVRLDGAGATLWEKTHGSAKADAAYAVDAADTGFVVAGTTWSEQNNGPTAWLMRVDPEGNRLWAETAGISDGYRSVRRTSDGFVMAGTALDQGRSQAWVVAVDGMGQNARPFLQRKGVSTATDVQVTDDGLIAVGTNDSAARGRPGLYILKLSAQARPQWERTIRGRDSDAYSRVLPLENGGFLIAGYTDRTDRSGAAAGAGRITLMDKDGNKKWDKLIGRNKAERIYALAPAGNDTYLLGGSVIERGGKSEDGWLVKIDMEGKILWDRRFGGDEEDRFYDLKALPGGGFLAVGSTRSKGAGRADLWLLRLDAEGQLPQPEPEGTARPAGPTPSPQQ